MGAKVDIYLPLFVADYLADTVDLSTEEHGAYLLMMMALWRRGGYLPLDHDDLARICKMKRARWNLTWRVLQRFFTETAAGVTQKRLLAELEKARARRQAASESGRAGAAKKWGSSPPAMATPMATPSIFDGDPNGDPIGLPLANGKPNDSSPSPSSPPAETESPPAGDPTGQGRSPAVVSAQWVLDAFAAVRREVFPQSLEWAVAGRGLYQKADQIAGFLQNHPEAIDDVRPTMKLALQRAGSSQDPEDQKVPVVFGTWVSQLTDLREELHGLRRPAARAPAAAAPLYYCRFHRNPKNRERTAPEHDDACPECRHARARARPRAASEPTAADPRMGWPNRDDDGVKAAGGNA